MAPKAKHLITYHPLKAIYKTDGHDHYRNAERRSGNSKPYNKTAEGFIILGGYALGDEI